jgi:hypothetical protein
MSGAQASEGGANDDNLMGRHDERVDVDGIRDRQ